MPFAIVRASLRAATRDTLLMEVPPMLDGIALTLVPG